MAMAVCGPDSKFYFINSNWPGSVHDARILRNSCIEELSFEKLAYNNTNGHKSQSSCTNSVPCFKAYFLEVISHWRTFYKMIHIQGCIFKMCPSFTYEVVGQRRRQKFFFRVLHEASSSWLKLCWFILGQPVYHVVTRMTNGKEPASL
jgi:hypothetical protein